MYVSPVVYPLSVIPEKWRYLASFNPMIGIIESARQIIFGESSLEFIFIINGLFTTLTLLLIGLIIFNRVEKNFVDTI
jgi:lipopolysaccharide transport system permease protein